MKKIWSCIFLILLSFYCFSKKLATLPELNNPGMIVINNGELFVLDDVKVYVYSLKDFKLLRQFGKRGEGPGELIPNTEVPTSIYVTRDYILLNTIKKMIYFSKGGKVLKEKTIPFAALQLIPLGKHFVTIKVSINEKSIQIFCVVLLNSNLEEKKTIYSRQRIHPIAKGKVNIPQELVYIRCDKNRIYLFDQKWEFIIKIFDNKGNPLKNIKLDYSRVKLTQSFKERAIKWLKLQPSIRLAPVDVKGMIRFSDYLPVMRSFMVMDQKICVHTYKNRGKLSEYIIIDLDNKTVKKTFLAGKWLTPVIGEFNTSYFIKNSKIYYIIENLDEDEWEIHSTDIFQSAESAYKITFLETAQ